MFWPVIQVALGGAVGSVLRYLTVAAVTAPLATFLVNVAGSFAMGVLYVGLANRTDLSPLLMAGILGGFTTFSAFSLDAVRLVEQGHLDRAVYYIAGSVALSIAALMIGMALARLLA